MRTATCGPACSVSPALNSRYSMRARNTCGGTGKSGDIMNSPSTRRSVMPSARWPAHSRTAVLRLEEGAEEGQAADMVEMGMGEEQVGIDLRP